MPSTYRETVVERRSQLDADAEAQREVFAQAYDIAMQVVQLREKLGLTQAELAERCGIDQGDISRIERGSVNPTTRTLQRLADALDARLQFVPLVS